MTEPTATIAVVVPAEEEDRILERFTRENVPVDALRDHLAEFLKGMEGALQAVPAALSGFRVEEVTLSLEVGASGKVGLIGIGAELSGTGGLTLKLTRQKETTEESAGQPEVDSAPFRLAAD